MTLPETVLCGRMNHQTGELVTSLVLSGQIMESLPLSIGDTTLRREVLPDGSRGDIRITTQEVHGILGNSVVYENYLLNNGRLTTDPDYNLGEKKPVGKLKQYWLLAKVALSRIDHWDAETDFFGTIEEL